MLTAADVRSARFTATKFRSGYEIVEVDEFLERSARTLDHLEQGLTVEADGTPLLTPADLLAARFSPTHLTEGYFVDEVDDVLDGIIDTLNTYIGRAERGEPLVQTGPDAPASSAVSGADDADAAAEAPAAEDEGTFGAPAAEDEGADENGTETAEPAPWTDAADASSAEEPTQEDAAPVVDVPVFDTPVADAPVAEAPAATVHAIDDASADAFGGLAPASSSAAASDVSADTFGEPAPAGDDVPGDGWAAALAQQAPGAPFAPEPFAPLTTSDDVPSSVEPSAPGGTALDELSSAPLWSPPASTDVTPSAWDAPVSETVEDAPVEDAPAEQPSDEQSSVEDGSAFGFTSSAHAATPELPASDVDAFAPAASTDWLPPAEQSSPWTEPDAVRWTAPTDGDEPADGNEPADLGTAPGEEVAEVLAPSELDVPAEQPAFVDDAVPFAQPDALAEVVAAAPAAGPAPWEPGFVPPTTPVATPDWGFNAPVADEDEWSATPADEPATTDATHAELPVAEPAPAATTSDEDSLLSSAEESPWASLDGDEPVALDLEDEVRDAESTDAELPAWLTDAQPEMAAASEQLAPVAEDALADGAEEASDAPAAEAPTRVSAFAFAAQAPDPDLDAPTILMDAVPATIPPATEVTAPEPEVAAEPAPAAEPDPAAVVTPEPDVTPSAPGPVATTSTSPAPHVAPAEALDSQGFLRQLTFARATSTGPAKDSITLVGPDGRVYSAVNVRKTAEGLVVDLG